MSGDLFKGFDSKNKLIPVPSVLLSSLLVEIDDFAELRCRNLENSDDLLKNDIKIMKIGVKIRIL